MLIRNILVVAVLVAAAAPAPTWADDAQLAKAHTLAPGREAAWVKAVQDTRTSDGTTVIQALRYAEKLRPSKFKVGTFEAGYNGGSGEPEGIGIDFWIGAKRDPGDAFSILFDVTDKDGKVIVSRPNTQGGGTAAEAVMAGRDELLRFIDEQYRENCIDESDGAKLC